MKTNSWLPPWTIEQSKPLDAFSTFEHAGLSRKWPHLRVVQYEIPLGMTLEQAWLFARRAGCGGSDAAGLYAENEHAGLFYLWHNKHSGVEIPADKEQVAAGIYFEDGVLRWLEDEIGMQFHRPGKMLFFNEARPRELMTADGLYFGHSDADPRLARGAEVKVPHFTKVWRWANGPPRGVWIQVQHYMGITGFEQWVVVAYLGSRQFAYWVVERDDAFLEQHHKVVDAFWTSIEEGNAPDPDAHETSEKAAKLLAPDVNKEEPVALPEEAFRWQDEYHHLGDQIEKLEAERARVKAQFEIAISDAPAGKLTTGQLVTFHKQQRTNYEPSKVIKSISSYRVLRIPRPKGD